MRENGNFGPHEGDFYSLMYTHFLRKYGDFGPLLTFAFLFFAFLPFAICFLPFVMFCKI